MLTSNHLQTLLQLDKSSPEFSDRLCGVLGEREFDEHITNLQTDGLLELIEYLDKVPSLH
jgi:hypothetical protein